MNERIPSEIENQVNDELQSPYIKHQSLRLPEPLLYGQDTITRMNREGKRNKDGELRIIDESRVALYRMPEGKQGVVIGSGPNTRQWRARGWITLDIDPKDHADITADANEMDKCFSPDSLDFIYAECVDMDPNGNDGISESRLLRVANELLKKGGKLIFKTAYFPYDDKTSLPMRDEYKRLMILHGFHTVVELEPYSGEPNTSSYAQQVFYYCEKMENVNFRRNE